MKKNIIVSICLILLVVLGGFFIIKKTDDVTSRKDHESTVYSMARDNVLGFEFTYREEPNGYLTLEESQIYDTDFVAGIVLFNRDDYQIFEKSTDARETPPAMRLRVYRNDAKLHAPVWVERKPSESNIALALAEPEETVVGGANAVHYVVDSLYSINTYVVAHGEHIYVLTGEYLDQNSKIVSDFEKLVQSFTFIPTPEQMGQGKIDVRIACESALAYTTFTDGAQADQFIAECIEGKHPDVINRYIESLNLDPAVI